MNNQQDRLPRVDFPREPTTPPDNQQDRQPRVDFPREPDTPPDIPIGSPGPEYWPLSDPATYRIQQFPLQSANRPPHTANHVIRTDPAHHVELENTGQRFETTLRHPQPRHPHASFLADSISPRPHTGCEGRVLSWLESTMEEAQQHSNPSPKSAPEMGLSRDVDGFLIPAVPSAGLPSMPSQLSSPRTGSAGSAGWKVNVAYPAYRNRLQTSNGIHLRSSCSQLPEHISDLIARISKDRGSPGPTADEVRQDSGLQTLILGAGETQIQQYFQTKVFPDSSPSGLKRSIQQVMSKSSIPTQGMHRISTPVPDLLFGYSFNAFTEQDAYIGLEDMFANTETLMLPFLVVEFKGDLPTGAGSLYVATNQCLGASASCIHLGERLNSQLRQLYGDQATQVTTTSFSIAMNGSETRLYVSWKHDEKSIYMQQIDSFLVQKPASYLEFRKTALNIIDWGMDTRLAEIQQAISGKTASNTAKSHPRSRYGSESGGRHKRSKTTV